MVLNNIIIREIEIDHRTLLLKLGTFVTGQKQNKEWIKLTLNYGQPKKKHYFKTKSNFYPVFDTMEDPFCHALMKAVVGKRYQYRKKTKVDNNLMDVIDINNVDDMIHCHKGGKKERKMKDQTRCCIQSCQAHCSPTNPLKRIPSLGGPTQSPMNAAKRRFILGEYLERCGLSRYLEEKKTKDLRICKSHELEPVQKSTPYQSPKGPKSFTFEFAAPVQTGPKGFINVSSSIVSKGIAIDR